MLLATGGQNHRATQRSESVRVLAGVTAVLALTSPVSQSAAANAPRATRITAAAPVTTQSDNAKPDATGTARITFSPNGDGRADTATITVAAPAATRLRLVAGYWQGASARRPHAPIWHTLYVSPTIRTPTTAAVAFMWNGTTTTGQSLSDGSYALSVCQATQRPPACGATRVVAQLRRLAVSVAQTSGLDPGQVVSLTVTTDQSGPFTATLDNYDSVGAAPIAAWQVLPGTTSLTIPAVTGGFYRLCVHDQAPTQTIGCAIVVVHGGSTSEPIPGTPLVVLPLLTIRVANEIDTRRTGHPDSWLTTTNSRSVPLTGPFEQPGVTPTCCAAGADVNGLMTWMGARRQSAVFVTDVELAGWSLSQLVRYRVVVLAGHTTDYTASVYALLRAFRDQGGRIMALSSDNIATRVAITSRRVTLTKRALHGADFSLLGDGFVAAGPWQSATYRMAEITPIADPWVLYTVALQPGATFGSIPGAIDGVDPQQSPANTTILARIEARTRSGRAVIGAMTLVTTTGGGEVFAAGSDGLVPGLVPPSPLAVILANVWRQFITPSVLAIPVLQGADHPLPGSVLRCQPGLYVGAAAVRVRWLRDGASIISARGERYRLVEHDAGHGISCQVIATDASQQGTLVVQTPERTVDAPLALQSRVLVRNRRGNVTVRVRCPTEDRGCSVRIDLLAGRPGRLLATKRVRLHPTLAFGVIGLRLRGATPRGRVVLRILYTTAYGGTHVILVRARIRVGA
jgi:hypothetical protein